MKFQKIYNYQSLDCHPERAKDLTIRAKVGLLLDPSHAQDDNKCCEGKMSPIWRHKLFTKIRWTQCVFPSAVERPKNTSNFIRLLISLLLITLSLSTLFAQPNLATATKIQGITIYEDIKNPRYFYYGPGELKLAIDKEKRPDFNLLMMRYTGNAATGDKGDIRYRNILRLGIKMNHPSPDSLEMIQSGLKAKHRRALLRPLPIHRLESVLIYNLVGEKGYQILPTGEYDADRESGLSNQSTFWIERDYAISLDNRSAELFETALRNGQVVLSVGYAFVSKGFSTFPEEGILTGSKELVDLMNQKLEALTDSLTSDSLATDQVIKSGAFSVHLDLDQWPDLIQKNDINEQLPPGYAALKVYNYDFNNEIRPDLYSKRLEIKAIGAAGDTVNVDTEFSFRQSDLYSKFIRFKYAVRLDQPFWFRWIETSRNGEEYVSAWEKRKNWTRIVDITTDSERLNELDIN